MNNNLNKFLDTKHTLMNTLFQNDSCYEITEIILGNIFSTNNYSYLHICLSRAFLYVN